MNLLARPSEWTLSGKDAASATPFAGGGQQYFAFLSYSHHDASTAKWIHNELERFRVPRNLVGGVTEHGPIPRRLTPIFRDLSELPASTDLGGEIREALAATKFLVVLCSPSAAQSRWTNAEIELFKRLRPEGCVLAAIIEGEPFASDIPGREHEECLPRALRFKYDRRGRPTSRPAEPLAADLRESGPGRRLGFLKLVAGMLGVGLDDLVHRDAVRNHQRLALLAAGSIVGMTITSALAVTAIQARDAARDQRREAESLVSFMLGDLKDKLEPIGKLDALDGVGAKVLAYYQAQDMSELPDSSLMQRARALSLMAGVANSRGDLDASMRLYRAAMAGTSEAIRRKPSDPQRLFDHAQNVFYTGDIALRRGDETAAEAAFRQYKTLSDREVALDPKNLQWRMEAQNADANLGIMLYNERRYLEASPRLEAALATMEGIVKAQPGNSDYQKSLAETLAWVADAHFAEGRIDAAIQDRQRLVSLLEQLLQESRGDVWYREKLITARKSLGKFYSYRRQLGAAIREARGALADAQKLLAVEHDNSRWIERTATVHMDLANYLLVSGKMQEAAAEATTACALVQSLLSKGSAVEDWRALRRACLLSQANVALASRKNSEALAYVEDALRGAASVDAGNSFDDGYGLAAYAVPRAYRLMGDAQSALGNREAARAAWKKALAKIPRTNSERPFEMSEHQIILQRMGRTTESQRLASKLRAMGYREPELPNG